MPVHDWTRVDAGVFHDFNNTWIAELRNALNGGLLPPAFYAMSEQHAGQRIPDVIRLQMSSPATEEPLAVSGGIAVADAPPKVRRRLSLSATARARRRTIAIRRVRDDRLVALIEIISPANKDRPKHVEALLNKLEDALTHGIHLLVVDPFPPGRYDRKGIHAALWDRLGDEPDEGQPPGEPVALAAYVADPPVSAFLEHVAFGSALPDMPLFLDPEIYINTPLEATYLPAWLGTPLRWRAILEGKRESGVRPRRKRR
jgi:hypothetical protein